MNLSAIISVLAAEQSSPASLAMTFIPLVLIIVFFYFFIIRPQKKQDKKDAEMRDNLEIGDEVVTNGGIVGIVFSIKDDTVVIETGGDRRSEDAKSSDKSCHLKNESRARKRIAEESGMSEGSVQNAFNYAKGVNAAEEVLPGIKNDLLSGKYKPKETDVAAVARASPEERREKAEQLRVFPEKKPKADKESARSGTKRQQEVYATIDKSYEDMKDSKRVTEDSALVSLRYTARNMVETCDVLFTNFPGLLEKPDYKDQVIEIMQEPKQYILKLEGETDNEQHSDTLQADGGQQPGFGDSRCVPAQAEHRACGKDRGRVQ